MLLKCLWFICACALTSYGGTDDFREAEHPLIQNPAFKILQAHLQEERGPHAVKAFKQLGLRYFKEARHNPGDDIPTKTCAILRALSHPQGLLPKHIKDIESMFFYGYHTLAPSQDFHIEVIYSLAGLMDLEDKTLIAEIPSFLYRHHFIRGDTSAEDISAYFTAAQDALSHSSPQRILRHMALYPSYTPLQHLQLIPPPTPRRRARREEDGYIMHRVSPEEAAERCQDNGEDPTTDDEFFDDYS